MIFTPECIRKEKDWGLPKNVSDDESVCIASTKSASVGSIRTDGGMFWKYGWAGSNAENSIILLSKFKLILITNAVISNFSYIYLLYTYNHYKSIQIIISNSEDKNYK